MSCLFSGLLTILRAMLSVSVEDFFKPLIATHPAPDFHCFWKVWHYPINVYRNKCCRCPGLGFYIPEVQALKGILDPLSIQILSNPFLSQRLALVIGVESIESGSMPYHHQFPRSQLAIGRWDHSVVSSCANPQIQITQAMPSVFNSDPTTSVRYGP